MEMIGAATHGSFGANDDIAFVNVEQPTARFAQLCQDYAGLPRWRQGKGGGLIILCFTDTASTLRVTRKLKIQLLAGQS